MIALYIAVAIVALTGAGGLMWRWMQVAEKVGVARETAGGDERAQAVKDLSARVEKLEKYAKGE